MEKKITEVDVIEQLSADDHIFVNQGGALRQITVEKLSEEIANLKENGTGGGGETVQIAQNIQTYITEDIGELYPAPSDYTAWSPCTLHFDKALDKFVSLIFGAPAHVHTTSDLYVSYIDKDSFIATKPVKCKFVDSDGVTDITPAKAGTTSWLILNDGTYLMIHVGSDGNTHRFISEDNGVSWKSTGTVTGGFECPWFITELSNGRLIASDDSSKVGIAYSDDKGFTWTTVIPVTCGGGYEAEACILELEAGKLIAIGRYSMSGQGAYSSGDSERAIVSYSSDYGTTWSEWQLSNTIDNMNASSCTGIVHNGVVEIFATSRWYALSGNTNTDNTNTGKNGALIHYTATIENALNDNFTRKGILDYAKGQGGEFHSPCLAVDDKENILICHMDGGETTTCTHRYLRGSLDNLSYLAKDGSKSSAKSYSAKYIELLMGAVTDKVNYLQLALSNIEGSGVDKPSGILALVKKYIAKEMQPNEIYPWHDGSDFYNEVDAAYLNNTGTGKVHEFLQDDNGEYYLKTYQLAVRTLKGDSVKNQCLVVDMKEISQMHMHIIKDGFITVADIFNGGVRTLPASGESGNTELSKGEITSRTSVKLEAGKLTVGEKVYNIPQVSVEDFLANYTGYERFQRHIRISELASADSTITEMTTTSDHIGLLVDAYHYIYGINYYEEY